MTFGERAAFEGIVSSVRPRLAVEVGRAEGGSLAVLAAHSAEVHSIDVKAPPTSAAANVRIHTGDSRRVLPALLAEIEAEGGNVDLALVDGDHSAAGVRADLENLLASAAVDQTLIVLHDTLNDAVRRGLRQASAERTDGVVYVNYDLVPGFVAGPGKFSGERWGGLGLVVVDRSGNPWRPGIEEDLHLDQHELLGRALGARPGPAQIARRAKARLKDRGRAIRRNLSGS
jgi:hypothetical protein